MHRETIHLDIRALDEAVDVDQSQYKTFHAALRILVKSTHQARAENEPFHIISDRNVWS